MHTDSPPEPEYVPAGQSAQPSACEGAPDAKPYVPAGHCAQLDWLEDPETVEKVPNEQFEHVEALTAPTAAECVPALQLAQPDEELGAPPLTLIPYWPAGHRLHEVCPLAEYWPCGHA